MAQIGFRCAIGQRLGMQFLQANSNQRLWSAMPSGGFWEASQDQNMRTEEDLHIVKIARRQPVFIPTHLGQRSSGWMTLAISICQMTV